MDAFFGQTGGATRGPRPRTRRGQDALIPLRIDLAEAAFGTTRELKVDTAVLCPTCSGSGAAAGSEPVTCDICHGRGEVTHTQRSFLGEVRTMRPCPNCRGFGTTIPNPCVECAGDGRVRSRRTVTVKIPGGVDSGTRVQLSGQGEVGPGGGPAGDLYVEIEVEPHDIFTRNGDDLHCTVTLPMTAAALGTTIDLPTLEGETTPLEIRPGTQSGTAMTLTARGVPAAAARRSWRPDRPGDRRDPDQARRLPGRAAEAAGRGCAARSARRVTSKPRTRVSSAASATPSAPTESWRPATMGLAASSTCLSSVAGLRRLS